ncbi:MAG: type II toxin-antitoxin system HicA family toxin, partial [Clostridia bacterium]|nr:type II toxin-antitoxin system HicA family toxin [Clostridia bacterium]
KNLRFDEIKKVLEAYGYVMHTSGKGSHRTFRKPGCEIVTIPEHEPVKIAYIKVIKAIVEGADKNEKNS